MSNFFAKLLVGKNANEPYILYKVSIFFKDNFSETTRYSGLKFSHNRNCYSPLIFREFILIASVGNETDIRPMRKKNLNSPIEVQFAKKYAT